MAPLLVAVVFCGSNRDGWFFKVPGRCRTLNGSIEGSGVYGSQPGSLLLRVAFYGYVPPAARLTYLMFHFTAPIAPTPMPTTLRLVIPRLILHRARLWFNQRPVAGSSVIPRLILQRARLWFNQRPVAGSSA